jgi:hypothetical protein
MAAQYGMGIGSYEGIGGYSYPPIPQGHIKVASQDGAHIAYRIIPDNTICERRKPKDLKGTDLIFMDPSQLNISAGDMVFQHQPHANSEYDCGYDDNVFSVFNGLKIPKKIWDCHAKFRFCGVALDDFPYAPGSLAPIGVDVQISGVANWVNGSDRMVYPGELVTWVPDSKDFDDQAYRPMKRRITGQHAAVKVRLIPLEETLMDMMYSIVRDDTSDIMKAVSFEEADVAAEVAALKTLVGGSPKSPCQGNCVNTVVAWRKLIPYLPVFFDRAIGKNLTPVASGGVGQMLLRV